jgi:hypothetical protein
MLQGQVGGFYDFRRKDLAIVVSPVAKGSVISREQKIDSVDVIAHELTDALRINFSIAKSLDNGSRDDDRSIALRAVLEGDGAGVAHRVERNGSSVLMMVGDGAICFHEFLAEVWKQSTVSSPPSQRPPG